MKFLLLINVKMLTFVVGILTFISMIITISLSFFSKKSLYFSPLDLLQAIKISSSVEFILKKVLEPLDLDTTQLGIQPIHAMGNCVYVI